MLGPIATEPSEAGDWGRWKGVAVDSALATGVALAVRLERQALQVAFVHRRVRDACERGNEPIAASAWSGPSRRAFDIELDALAREVALATDALYRAIEASRRAAETLANRVG